MGAALSVGRATDGFFGVADAATNDVLTAGRRASHDPQAVGVVGLALVVTEGLAVLNRGAPRLGCVRA